jgi:hypothetical protein
MIGIASAAAMKPARVYMGRKSLRRAFPMNHLCGATIHGVHRGGDQAQTQSRPAEEEARPVDHRLTPKMRTAIVAMVEDGMSVEDAAKHAGLTSSAIYKAMKNPPAREFYTSELRQLLHCAKAQAAHALIRELRGDNAAARVAAARTLLADDERKAPAQGMPQV